MISNAGGMGLDWRWLSLSSYFEALEANNAAHDPNAAKGGGVSDGLKKFMASHGLGGQNGRD